MRTGGLRVLVLGYVVRGPVGGFASYHLNYLMGLADLGHDVFFIEDSDDYPSCYDPIRHTTDIDPSYGLQMASRTFDRVGLGSRWAFHDAHRSEWHGPCGGRIAELRSTADLLLNLGGANPVRPWFDGIAVRVLLDLDPVFTQIRHLTDPASRARAAWHTAFFSIGENIGLPGCGVPDDGLPWQPTRQPLVPRLWPPAEGRAGGKLTTVMQWESYPAVEFRGVRYGVKADSFTPFLDLPSRVGDVFELAVGGHPDATDQLRRLGWRLRDPLEVTRDVWTYQQYVRESSGEFSIAKQAYVISGSGWFSDRTVAYLATGRPVLAQDTAFSRWLPTGDGVVAFQTPDDVVAAIEDLRTRYACHARTAVELAREYFDAAKVLSSLVHRAMEPPR